jgi:hypothetical protein
VGCRICYTAQLPTRESLQPMTVADVIIAAVIVCCAVVFGWWLLSERQNK